MRYDVANDRRSPTEQDVSDTKIIVADKVLELGPDSRRDLEILAENAQALRRWGQEMRSLLEQCVGRAPAS